VTVASTAHSVSGDSAVWITTPGGLFNAQLITYSAIPEAPTPVMLFVGFTDPSLNEAPLPPGTYAVAAADPSIPVVALSGDGFQALADSGTLTVITPRADSLFEGSLVAWLQDTSTSSPTHYHVHAQFAAVPFH
jgi:hypothetical protein